MNAEDQKELIPMGPGDLLRYAREKKGASIEQIAGEIRVRPEFLRSIEAGETSHIPSVYLKGYIRSYARHLGVPAQSIEKTLPHAQGAEPEVQSVFTARLPRSPGERWFKATSYVLASAVVIALAWQFTNEAVRFSQGGSLLSRSDPDGMRAESPEQQSEPATAAAGNGSTHLKASIAPLELNDSHAAPAPGGGKVAEGAWAAMARRDAAIDPSASASALASVSSGDADLAIATSADSWIEITDGNGEQIELDLLRAGTSREYRGEKPFRLLIGRASSVELIYNGQKFDLAPYTRGNVARVTLGAEQQTAKPPGDELPQQEPPAEDGDAGAEPPTGTDQG